MCGGSPPSWWFPTPFGIGFDVFVIPKHREF
jgi:hypothetical protein